MWSLAVVDNLQATPPATNFSNGPWTLRLLKLSDISVSRWHAVKTCSWIPGALEAWDVLEAYNSLGEY